MRKGIVLGGGIAGLGAYMANNDLEVYEAEKEAGGLCNSFNINGYVFDNAVHLSFSKINEVKDLFEKTPLFIHHPIPMNWHYDRWIQHPVQNNLYKLSADIKINAIESFVNRPNIENPISFREWNLHNYGEYITDNFIDKYNKKYWCFDMNEMSTEWVGNRLYRPSLHEVLMGSFTEETPNTYYAPEMRYPKRGGYKSFIEHIEKDAKDKKKIHLDKKVIRIEEDKHVIFFEDGETEEYDYLINTIPIPEFVNLVCDKDENIKKATEKLQWTSMVLVSVGISKRDAVPFTWFYIYDDDIMAARCYSPYKKSYNNGPDGHSSIQFEIYYHHNQECPKRVDCEKNVIYALEKMGIAQKSEIEFIDYRVVPYANIIFNKNLGNSPEEIISYYQNKDIYFAGRFGEWKYYWSDQAYMSGVRIATRLKEVYVDG